MHMPGRHEQQNHAGIDLDYMRNKVLGMITSIIEDAAKLKDKEPRLYAGQNQRAREILDVLDAARSGDLNKMRDTFKKLHSGDAGREAFTDLRELLGD